MPAAILYDYFRSSASYRVRIALNLKGLAYDRVAIDLRTGEQQHNSNLSRNPLGFVPSYHTGEILLTQSLAIIEYLEETKPHPPLLPIDPVQRARHRALALTIAADTHPIQNLSVVRHIETLVPDQEGMGADWVRYFIRRGLLAFASLLKNEPEGRYASGHEPGLVDCCLVPQIYNARRWETNMEGLERLEEITDLCNQLEAFKKAHPDLLP
jgi:maleylacetoacetate isomerase